LLKIVLTAVFQKQVMMRKVLISLIPIFLFASYMYGLRLLFLILIVFPLGIIAEFIFEKVKKKKVSEAVLVTCSLYVLSLPPNAPWWVAGIGILFGVVIGKETFGGFGRNPFNPAIAGRLFIYLTFPTFMTAGWIGGGNFGVDAVSAATPLALQRMGQSPDLISMLIGLRPGALGESPVILILIAAIFLMVTRTASWIIILSTFASAGLLTFILDMAGVAGAFDTLPAIMSGSLLFVTVFMATDPVSAPKHKPAQLLYGAIIGTTSVLIRTFSPSFSEGTSFGIMMGNTFAMLFDEMTGKKKK
jgi:Na+-transporting NADH:ubiquinone oxidoreductase subunit B